MTGRRRYEDELKRLYLAAGSPGSKKLAHEIKARYGEDVSVQTLDGWCEGNGVPRRTEKLTAFWRTLALLARERNGRVHIPSPEGWNVLLKEARKRRDEEQRHEDGSVAERPMTTGLPRIWRQLAQNSEAWSLVPGSAAERATALREQTADAASRLAELYDGESELLAQDPWYDPELARRTVRWTDLRLADIRRTLDAPTLSPAEAALIALLPFLYQVQHAWIVAELAVVDPTDLDEQAPGGPARAAFNAVLAGHKRLVRAAKLGTTLPDRGDGRAEVGWWLFHRWVKPQAAQPDRLERVLDALGPAGADLATVLEHPCLPWLLTCAHLGPRGLFREPPAESSYIDFGGHDAQQVRALLVGPLFAIGHAMAIEVTDLPSAVAEHVGIPEPLVPAQLLARVNKAKWTPVGDTLALDAPCDHPAAVAALTEHARHVDALLREARRTRPTPEIGALPVYAHADGVREVDERNQPRQAGEVIRFRLDEERIQELLMGENLYRDRALAIRELYQNALDACRYARAYQFRRDGRDTFQGRITFRQGFDEDEQRHYLECQDEGIGMDETVLAEVFSRAGVRFGDHPRSRDWADDDGLAVRPNSRFGIGVLSYFMLADEIRVTTCPMDTREGSQEQLTVLITGPGHYFRVRRTGRWGPVGTTVRLYLRDGKDAPSCVRELRRLLGVAEFPVTAERDGGQESATWEPGVLKPREAAGGRSDGFVAHGRTVSWPQGDARADGQVIWCEHGGGLLADGIFIEPRARRGVLAGPEGAGRLRGVVVDLTGRTRPRDLSVDRAEILDPDVDQVVEELIEAALPTLLAADPPLLTGEWLTDVLRHSPRLADLVARASGEAGVALAVHGHPAPVATAGFFALDPTLVHRAGREENPSPLRLISGRLDGATQLWRLLAHAPNAELTALTSLVLELARVRAVLPARPSDLLLRSTGSSGREQRSWIDTDDDEEPVPPGQVLAAALACGMSYEETLARMELLGLPVPTRPVGAVALDDTTAALLDADLRYAGTNRWLRLADPVPPGHLVKAHLTLNIRFEEAIERLRALCFQVPERGLPTVAPEDWVVRLLSARLTGERPWLTPAEPIRAGWVLRAMSELGRSLDEVVGALRDYGLSPEPGSLDDESARELLRLSADWGWAPATLGSLDAEEPVRPGFLLHASLRSGEPLADIARRMRELGFFVGSLPDRIEDTDLVLLNVHEHDVYALDLEPNLSELVERAVESGLAPTSAAARLRAYGLRPCHVTLPEQAGPHDGRTLNEVYRQLPSGADDLTDCVVPTLVILRSAQQLRLPPQTVIDCLRRYGVRVARTEAPTTASMYDEELVRLKRHGRGLDWGRPVPLFHLVVVPPQLLMEREEAARRLSESGLEIPARGLDELSTAELRLCGEGFGSGRGDLPLELDDPIGDFLYIVGYAGLPLAELLTGLTRLDVDLPRVAEAVRAALPRVPGLVMAPEDEPVVDRDGDPTTATTAPRSPAT
ncbi:wHTH domain-containing protein [Streptomyces sp. Adlamb9]|uniref:wHTH domain-containing protein n=1 Tax=Streptomyces sp. Adlamb9 TaxID=3400629 RepID=UPI003F1C5BF7